MRTQQSLKVQKENKYEEVITDRKIIGGARRFRSEGENHMVVGVAPAPRLYAVVSMDVGSMLFL